jgi:hypothetical protein
METRDKVDAKRMLDGVELSGVMRAGVEPGLEAALQAIEAETDLTEEGMTVRSTSFATI